MVIENAKSENEYILGLINNSKTEEQLCGILANIRRNLDSIKTLAITLMSPEILELLMKFIASSSIRIQVETSWLISVITTSESEELIKPLIKLEYIRAIESRLGSENPQLQVHIIHTLANIAAFDKDYRDLLIKEEIPDKVNMLLNQKYLENKVHHAAIFLICNIFSAGPIPSSAEINQLVAHIMDALWVNEDEVLIDALWALKFITDSTSVINYSHALNKETAQAILIYIQSENQRVADLAMEVLGNLSAGQDLDGELLTACGAMDVIKEILEGDKNNSIKRNIIWILSNLIACGPLVISEFLSVKVHLTILKFLFGENIGIIQETGWVICNALMKGTNKQIITLIQDGVLEKYLNLLFINDSNIRYFVLDTISKVLKLKDCYVKGNLLKQLNDNKIIMNLEELRDGSNRTNSKIAAEILKELESENYGDYEMLEM